MKHHLLVSFIGLLIAIASIGAFAQQEKTSVSAYLVSVELTSEGVKILQKKNITPGVVSTRIEKFAASIGGKLEPWYFDQLGTTGYGIVAYQDGATPDPLTLDITVKANDTEIAHLTMRPLITKEEADKAFTLLSQALQKQ
jgi:hypothetical protein